MSCLKPEIAAALNHLRTLQSDYHDFNSSAVPVIPQPSALQFSRIVAKGQPAVFGIYEASAHAGPSSGPWGACSWDRAGLEDRITQPVEVAWTPHGNADALVSLVRNEVKHADEDAAKVFLQPATRHMLISELLDKLRCSTGKMKSNQDEPVLYLQSQNSNLDTDALSPLREDLPANFDFAKDVLGEPDARNIWIGDGRSVTSVHRDPYENLYLVVRGSKTFRLWAPVDEVAMPTSMVRTGRYEHADTAACGGQFSVVMDEDNQSGRIPWVDLDPLASDFQDPGKMRQVTVSQGQMLYLPSGWYHHVTQQCGSWDDGSPAPCIAVNYWYDMDYEGEKYVMRQLVSRLVEMVRDPMNGS